MPTPTDEQIDRWRARWEKHPGLAEKILQILKGEKPAETAEEAARRMWQVNEILPGGDFEVYKGDGIETFIIKRNKKIPTLDLRGIPWIDIDAPEIILPRAHLNGGCFGIARLEEANFSFAHLNGAIFQGASLKATRIP